jgi:hypothetical protein
MLAKVREKQGKRLFLLIYNLLVTTPLAACAVAANPSRTTPYT